MNSKRAAFDRCYDHYLSPVEGGVHHNESGSDRGGSTWYGVSQNYLASTGRTGPVSRSEAREILYKEFWFEYGCDELPDVVAWCHFDALVNHNPKDAVKVLQRSVGANPDGIFGTITLSLAREADGIKFWRLYRLHRARLYASVIRRHPDQVANLAGWIVRTHELPEAMMIQGLFKEDVQRLKWLTPRIAKETKTGAAGVVSAAGMLALLGPEFEGLMELLRSPEGLTSIVTGMVAKFLAGWRVQNDEKA